MGQGIGLRKAALILKPEIDPTEVVLSISQLVLVCRHAQRKD